VNTALASAILSAPVAKSVIVAISPATSGVSNWKLSLPPPSGRSRHPPPRR
jgi:hypothetical protein